MSLQLQPHFKFYSKVPSPQLVLGTIFQYSYSYIFLFASIFITLSHRPLLVFCRHIIFIAYFFTFLLFSTIIAVPTHFSILYRTLSYSIYLPPIFITTSILNPCLFCRSFCVKILVCSIFSSCEEQEQF